MVELNLITHGICFGIGIVIGMYITTQISEWIDRRIKK